MSATPSGVVDQRVRGDVRDVALVPDRADLRGIPSGREPVRKVSQVDGDHLYFNEGLTLKRMKKDGSDRIELAPGNEHDWVMPLVTGIGPDFVYFQRITKRATTTRDAQVFGTLHRTRK